MIDKVAIMNKARKEYSQQHEVKVREEARRTFNQYKNRPLFIAGIMLFGRKFWSRKLKIPLSQFNKSIILNSRARITKNKLLYGTCRVLAGSRNERITMETWIDCFCRQNQEIKN